MTTTKTTTKTKPRSRLFTEFFTGCFMTCLLFSGLHAEASCATHPATPTHRLAACPSAPHCVSSHASPENDSKHAIAPFAYQGDPVVAQKKLKTMLLQLPRTTLVIEEPGYLHVEVRSALFHFVDDVEVEFDAQNKRIHIRSAARLGYFDFNVNRNRIETLRTRFDSTTHTTSPQ